MSKAHIDFETASTVDIKKSGGWKYAASDETIVLCMAWCIDDGPVEMWTPAEPFPDALRQHIAAGCELHGWNVAFEIGVWENIGVRRHGFPTVELTQWHDTMAAAAYWGLPLSLDQAGSALGSSFQKDKAGHSLMLRMSKPRRVTPQGPVWWHNEDAAKFAALQDYCRQDVKTERSIANLLPPLPDQERQYWLMDLRMNRRGIEIDPQLIDALETITQETIELLSQEMSALTGGAVPSVTTVGKLIDWLTANGIEVDSVAKDALSDLLHTTTGTVHDVLLVRQEAAKSSTAKLRSMAAAAGKDNRIRGLVQFYGASRTGRWAGRLSQVQNYPRPIKGIKVDWAIRDIKAGLNATDLREIHGRPLDVVSSCLRGCFVPKADHAFAVCDFSQIEARVVAWLAGQHDILEVFASGQDVYVYTAAKIGSKDRQLGKVAVLGLGFGMGPVKFVDAAKTYGIALDPEHAEDVVRQWRSANRRIQTLWYDCDAAARSVIENDDTQGIHVGHLLFRMGRNKLAGAMLIQLPSGRFLVYRDAKLITHDGKTSISYMGVDQYTRKWTRIRTYGGKLVENCTQAVARCLMAHAMFEIDKLNLAPITTIHDEVICEVSEDRAAEALSLMKQAMSQPPVWAEGIPLGGEGWTGNRYGKG